MTKEAYAAIEVYMLTCMKDVAHDKHHIYRVLSVAVDIAAHEKNVNMDVLIAACVMHDIGRGAQEIDPKLCHAQVGGQMAYDFLLTQNWQQAQALHVQECISTHRYRGDNIPHSIEAKILFDADKMDACGAIGIARTLIYAGQMDIPMYAKSEDGNILTEKMESGTHSFVQEYNFKLKKVYDTFYTAHAKTIASERQEIAKNFYNGFMSEIQTNIGGLFTHEN